MISRSRSLELIRQALKRSRVGAPADGPCPGERGRPVSAPGARANPSPNGRSESEVIPWEPLAAPACPPGFVAGRFRKDQFEQWIEQQSRDPGSRHK